MNIIKEDNGYITSLLVVLLMIPVVILLILTISTTSDYVNETSTSIESDRLSSLTVDFKSDISTITKQSLNNITRTVIENNLPLTNSSKEIKEDIQKRVDTRESLYYNNTGIIVDCNITNVKPSSDPFNITVTYSIATSMNSTEKITESNIIEVELTDSNYPVYDPLPTLVTGVTIDNTTASFKDLLSSIIKIENPEVYNDATSGVIIKKCPYTDYTLHGNNNTTIANCISNHYYHVSNDGLCLLCRLENRTTCSDTGFETFIIPSVNNNDTACTSIDHVLLNLTGQYNGVAITIDNSTVLYLDEGHRNKYGL